MARQPDDSSTSTRSQPSLHCIAAVLRQQDHDLEMAIMQSSPSQGPQPPSCNLHDFDMVRDHRSQWAPPGSTDVDGDTPFIQDVCDTSLARHRQTGILSSACQLALYAPEQKQVLVKQAELGITSSNRFKPAGEEGRQSARQQPRLVSNAVDQTHQLDAQAAHRQSAETAAQPEEPGQARLLQSGAEQGINTGAEQRHLHRLTSTTGSTMTQLATPVEAGQQTDAMHRDVSLSRHTDMFKPPCGTSGTFACPKPALSKLESINSRSDPSFFMPPATISGQGKTPAKAGHHVNGSATRKRLHGHISGRLKQLPGPSRLGISKDSLAKQPDAQSSDVTGIPDSKTCSNPFVSGQACDTVNNQDATEGQVADQKAPARLWHLAVLHTHAC